MSDGKVTEELAEFIASRSFEDLDEATVEVSKQCLLDCLGVAIAASGEPLVNILLAQQSEEGGNPQATLLAAGRKGSLQQASLINGAMAHAHDYDDVHTAMSGHPTVPVAPAILALAEYAGHSGKEVITALATGIDTECLLGRYLGPSHYARGFHATGTLGALGAAAACANLRALDAQVTAHALGIAATQAAGLKSMFGSMCKPLHAGKAAANGVLAAQLAEKGFDSQIASLEIGQGFASTHSETVSYASFREALERLSFVPTTLFKYHAACYLTHSTLEATRALKREYNIVPENVSQVRIEVDQGHFGVCNIQEARSGLQAKFSLRFACAMALAGVDTANIESFNDELTGRQDMIDLRDRIQVVRHESPRAESDVEIRLTDGQVVSKAWDVAIPEPNLAAQRNKLSEKFTSLVEPRFGAERAAAICRIVLNLESEGSLANLMARVA